MPRTARPRTRPVSRPVARALLVPYLVALGLIVFLPSAEAGRVTGIVEVLADFVATFGVPREPAAIVFEFVANIVLFVPFGVLVALAWPRWSPLLVIGLGFATSLSIELVQIALPSRFPTVSDVIANTTGAALGYFVVAWWRLRRPTAPPRSAPRGAPAPRG